MLMRVWFVHDALFRAHSLSYVTPSDPQTFSAPGGSFTCNIITKLILIATMSVIIYGNVKLKKFDLNLKSL